MSNVEIEDVLSSIRRLVSSDARTPATRKPSAKAEDGSDALILTPAQRVPQDHNLFAEDTASEDVEQAGNAVHETGDAGDAAASETGAEDDDRDIALEPEDQEPETGQTHESAAVQRIEATVTRLAALNVSPIAVNDSDTEDQDDEAAEADPSSAIFLHDADTQDELRARIAELEALLRRQASDPADQPAEPEPVIASEMFETPVAWAPDELAAQQDVADETGEGAEEDVEVAERSDDEEFEDAGEPETAGDDDWSDVLEARAESLESDTATPLSDSEDQQDENAGNDDVADLTDAIEAQNMWSNDAETAEEEPFHDAEEPEIADASGDHSSEADPAEAALPLASEDVTEDASTEDNVASLLAADAEQDHAFEEAEAAWTEPDTDSDDEDEPWDEPETQQSQSEDHDDDPDTGLLPSDDAQPLATDAQPDEPVAEPAAEPVHDAEASFREHPAFHSVRARIGTMAEGVATGMAASALLGDDLTAGPDESGYIDEETLREMVAEIVREELQGALGERITRNVRKLVRREIHRALVSRDFE